MQGLMMQWMVLDPKCPIACGHSPVYLYLYQINKEIKHLRAYLESSSKELNINIKIKKILSYKLNFTS